jgi:uncharacterized LabA/DUF88 family protein
VARSSPKKSAAPRGRAAKSGGRAGKSRPARRQADAASTSTPEAAKGQQGQRIGVLIDADNVSHQHLPTLRRFIGETPISAARAYGDFHGRLSGWRAVAQEWPELELVDQRSYTPGKNAADMRLTIDAVKLMAGTQPPTTLIFVTNDSDFTPVVEDAKRLGVRIVVMGERTHKALRSTAHHYLNLSELRERMDAEERAKSDPKAALAVLAQAIRELTPKTKAKALALLDQFEKMLPDVRFGDARPPRPAAPPREPKPAREPRERRGHREERAPKAPEGNGQDYRDTPNLSASQQAQGKAEADQRRAQLQQRQDIIDALVDVATGLAPEGEWMKVEFIKKFLIQEHPGLEANAPRYAKFYRMLEDTGRFDVDLRGSTVFARLKPGADPDGRPGA